MPNLTHLEVGKLSLIQETEDGRIRQIGLTVSQSEQLQLFLAVISKDSPLIQLDEEYDLKFKT